VSARPRCRGRQESRRESNDPGLSKGRLAPALTCAFSGADDGIRTGDPHLSDCMAVVSCVSAGLSCAPELHVLGALVSSVSPNRWSRLDFVGDFVGVPAAVLPKAVLVNAAGPPSGRTSSPLREFGRRGRSEVRSWRQWARFPPPRHDYDPSPVSRRVRPIHGAISPLARVSHRPSIRASSSVRTRARPGVTRSRLDRGARGQGPLSARVRPHPRRPGRIQPSGL
jgi:hypothetical protein